MKDINVIKNNRNLQGMPKTSKFWQDWKKNNPNLDINLRSIAIGMLLGDAGLHKVGKEAYIKFEQGYNQKEFILNLYENFKLYTFMEDVGIRYIKDTKIIKSYWFKTYSHKTFTDLWNLFYDIKQLDRGKIIKPNLILKELTPLALAYWIMSDGSLNNNKKSMILHTQGWNKEMNDIISNELNIKFNLNSSVIAHKKKYFVIFIPSKDSYNLYNLINKYIIESMKYKLPSNLELDAPR